MSGRVAFQYRALNEERRGAGAWAGARWRFNTEHLMKREEGQGCGQSRAAFRFWAVNEEGGMAGWRFNTWHLMKREEGQGCGQGPGGVSIPGT